MRTVLLNPRGGKVAKKKAEDNPTPKRRRKSRKKGFMAGKGEQAAGTILGGALHGVMIDPTMEMLSLGPVELGETGTNVLVGVMGVLTGAWMKNKFAAAIGYGMAAGAASGIMREQGLFSSAVQGPVGPNRLDRAIARDRSRKDVEAAMLRLENLERGAGGLAIGQRGPAGLAIGGLILDVEAS